MKNNYLRQAWLVIVLALCFGAALAGVRISLQPRIDQNKLNETYEQIPELLRIWDDASRTYKPAHKNRTREFLTDEGKIAYKAFSADGEHLGWVIKAAGQG
ncbi:MAG: FMN-binding protein, partial [Phycisphaerae bacterium]|nr:FMN-binding protein [Phycisphaerae bacterium]